jgi:hypothetical protein
MNAKEMIMKPSTIAKAFATTLAALALGIAPNAKADEGCSNATLKGTFSYTSTGFITAPPALAGPFAEVGTQTFDGKGGTTAAATLSQNGNILQVTITGTYTVNPDCTGTFTLQVSPLGITVHVFLAIDNSGTEFQAIETEQGIVITPSDGGNFQWTTGDNEQFDPRPREQESLLLSLSFVSSCRDRKLIRGDQRRGSERMSATRRLSCNRVRGSN